MREVREEVERALSLLVEASRVSPPLRDAVRVVEDELRRAKRLCAHADRDGEGAHWLAAGEVCDA